MTDQPIAIIGMACRFPQAEDLSAYWSNILNGLDAVGEPDPSWGAPRYLADGRISTARGGYLRDLFHFDPSRFGIMPRALDGGEPDQFLALEIAHAALADAGYLDGADHRNTGIILGHSTYLHRGNANVVQHGIVLDQTVELLRALVPQGSENWLIELRQLLEKQLPPFSADIAPGLVPNVMTGRIANRLDLQGPNYLIDAACASSLLSVGAAMDELRSGRSDLMLAGGVNASLPAEVTMVFTQLGALSRTGRIRPFSTAANGTLLGEGLGMVVLKRLDDALRDGDRIYASLLAVGQSSDGKATGLLAPRLEGEILAIERAFRQAGADPGACGLIEAHGTGIPLGDRTEIQALRSVLGPRLRRLPHCAIGSVKSMISHCIPAAGIAGLIKTALALHHRILPPTICEEVNPELGLDQTTLYVNNQVRPWIHGEPGGRLAGVDAFGFGGINTHALLREGPEARLDTLTLWPQELVLLSAESRELLLQRVDGLMKRLAMPAPSPGLCDLAAEFAESAAQCGHRLAIIASDLGDLARKLERAHVRLEDPECTQFQTRSGVYFSSSPITGGLAFLFPGEGSQYTGMLDALARTFPVVRQAFDDWDAACAPGREYRPSEVVFPPPTGLSQERREALEAELDGLELGSEAVFFASRALASLVGSLGIEADALVGHSSGEHSAMLAAGVVQLESADTLKEHVRELNALYHELAASDAIATGALLAVGAVPRNRILELVDASGGQLHLALDNCLHQAVLFGPEQVIADTARCLRAEGGLCSMLPADRAYHTPLFKPVAAAVEAFYRRIPMRAAEIPLYSCASAAPFPAVQDAIRALAAGQWADRVRFVETIERLYADGMRFFLEVGPSSTLTGFVNDILRDRDHVAAALDHRQKGGIEPLLHALARLFVHQRHFDPGVLFRRRGLRVSQIAPEPRHTRLAQTLPYISVAPGDLPSLPSDRAAAPAATGWILSEPATGPVSAPHSSEAWGSLSPPPADTDQVLLEHLGLMQEFLSRQSRFSGPGNFHEPSPALGTETLNRNPLITRVLSRDALQAHAETDLSVAHQRFLRHHILYSRYVSDSDPELHGLAVLPLAVSLELLAEVASLLRPDKSPMTLADVRAYDWIACDEGQRSLVLRAQSLGDERVHAAIHASAEEGGARLLEATVQFAETVVPEHLPALTAPQASAWQDHQLYTSGMFHGPLYHAIRHLHAWDAGGMDAELNDTPLTGFIAAESAAPHLWINPVLLDAVGHLTAFWVAQQRGTDFSSFPSSIDRIHLVAPREQATGGGLLRGRLAFLDSERFLQGDFEAVDAQGNLLLRIQGWRDRFFSVPHRFFLARTAPREGWYGQDATALIPEPVSEDRVAWSIAPFPDGFLVDAGGIWARVLAHTVLDREERVVWNRVAATRPESRDWLLLRLTIKEAVRLWLWRNRGFLPCPADVWVRECPDNRLIATGPWDNSLGAAPTVDVIGSDRSPIVIVRPPPEFDMDTAPFSERAHG
jgi:acyl transferase domain-containing protein